MKKKLLILVLTGSLVNSIAYSQKADSVNDKKKQKYFSVKITWMNSEEDKYSLSHFSNDSIYIFPLLVKDKNKEIQINKKAGVKAENIKWIYIYTDKKVSLPDSLEYLISINRRVSDSIASNVRKLNTKYELTGYALNQVLFPLDPVTNLFSLGLSLLIGHNGTRFYIGGKESNFFKMINKLTGKKSVTKNIKMAKTKSLNQS